MACCATGHVLFAPGRTSRGINDQQENVSSLASAATRLPRRGNHFGARPKPLSVSSRAMGSALHGRRRNRRDVPADLPATVGSAGPALRRREQTRGRQQIGTQNVINSPADGYTLLLTSTANAINAPSIPRCRTILPKESCRSRASPASRWCWSSTTIPAHRLGIHRLRQGQSRKTQDRLSGIGTSLHLSGELFKAKAGIDFVHVPYRGSAPGLTDVMSGQIQGMFDNVTSSFELVRSGKLRALGVTTMGALGDHARCAADRRHAEGI